MEESRRGVSPGCEEFLAAILDKPNPADGAAFAAAVLREYNPDEPRDAWGRWTTGGSSGGSTKTTVPLGRGKPHAQGGHAQWPADRESDKKSLQDMLRSLGPTTPTPTDASADANSAIFGMREFTSKSGTKEPFNAQFAGFDVTATSNSRKPMEPRSWRTRSISATRTHNSSTIWRSWGKIRGSWRD